MSPMGPMPAMASATAVPRTVAMMVAMMLPSVAPTLWRSHRRLRATAGARAARTTSSLAAGYAGVWVAIALGMFAISMELPRTGVPPLAAGAIVLIAGALQRSPWKAAQLHHCVHACFLTDAPPNPMGAWRTGCELGVHCALSCAAAMTVLLVAGFMDLRVMLAVTATITAERILPAGERIARATGTLGVILGLTICMRALAS